MILQVTRISIRYFSSHLHGSWQHSIPEWQTSVRAVELAWELDNTYAHMLACEISQVSSASDSNEGRYDNRTIEDTIVLLISRCQRTESHTSMAQRLNYP